MAIDKRLKIYDDQGHDVDYDIMADDVKFLPDGKDLPTKLDELEQEIGEGGYTPPAGGIPKTDLAPSVQTSLDKADTAVQDPNYVHTSNDYTTAEKNKLAGIAEGAEANVQSDWNASSGDAAILNKPTILSQQQVAGMIEDAIEDMPTGDIPTKVSELENDRGYITAEEVGEIVATTGDIAIVETSDYVDIMIYSPEMSVKLGGNEVSSLAFFSDPTQQESLSLAVSGSHLKANIVATLEGTDANKFSVSGSPITPTGGAASGTLTVAYTGTTAAGQSANATLKLTCGNLVKTISLHYAYASGPFISVNPASLLFKAGTGSTEAKAIAISASQLTNDVVVSVPSGSAFLVCATENGTYGNSVTVAKADAEAGKTIYVKYTAGSSAASASLTVSSTGATSRTVALSGAVSTITVSTNSLTLSAEQGGSATGTFTIEGANLNEDISISASGTGFSVSPQTIAHSNGSVASTTVTVTYSPSAAGTHTGSISIQSSGVIKTISLSGTAAQATTSDENGRFSKKISGKTIYFGRISDGNGGFTNDVAVYNKDYNTSAAAASANRYTGDIVIPATVACDGTTYNVTTLASKAFHSCSGMTSLTLPEGLTTINFEAIRECANNSFTSLIIPNSVTSMGANNLYNCDKLTNLVFGDGLTAIPTYVMPGKNGMTNVVIGSNVASFAKNVVFKMADIGVVTIKRETPPSFQSVVFKTASDTYPSNATLRVPSSAVNAYKTASGWGVDNSSNWHMFNPDNIVAIDE